jgi:hypothetical protein
LPSGLVQAIRVRCTLERLSLPSLSEDNALPFDRSGGGELRRGHSTVIASEAKQSSTEAPLSRHRRCERSEANQRGTAALVCFVALLLAMTNYGSTKNYLL